MTALHHEDEIDHAQAMIDWLADKTPDVWFEVTPRLNWDTSERVLDWIVSQPECDRANAAMILWAADPLYFLRRMAAGEQPWSDSFRLIEKVLRNWRSGFYRRSELAWPEDHRKAHADTIATLPGKRDPLSIPKDLLGPLKGRQPNVPDHLRAENNAVLYDLFYGLATMIGPRPGSQKWHELRDPLLRKKQELARQRADVLAIARERLISLWRALAWIALAAVVSVVGAFVLRWIVKGVLF